MTYLTDPKFTTQADLSLYADPSTKSSLEFSEENPDWVISFDGAMEPADEPGARGSWGIVVQDATGKKIHINGALMDVGKCISNNVAEYTALMRAIEWVEKNLPHDDAILFQGDSQVVTHNVRGAWGWNSKKSARSPHRAAPHLRIFLNSVDQKLRRFRPLARPFISEPGSNALANSLPIIWVKGENNPADEASRKPFEDAGITYRKR